jgi:hypothetical protein
LQTARNINGVSFNGSADITVTAAAGTLSGATLASGVTASSLTSVGTLASLAVTGNLTVDTNTLFVDAANNRVGVGYSSPSYNMVVGTPGTTADTIVQIGSSASTTGNVFFGDAPGTGAAGNAGYLQYNHSTNAMVFGTDSLARATIDASGNVGIGATSTTERLRVESSDIYQLSLKNSGGGVLAALGVDTSSNLRFNVNSTERARIIAGGYLKASDSGSYYDATGAYHELRQTADANAVVFSAPNASLTTNGVCIISASRNTTDNTFYAFSYFNEGAAAYKFRVADSGNVTNTNNSYGSLSDVKLKQDITDAGSSWDDIKAVRFRKYRLKSDVAEKGDQAKYMLGVIAQELREVSPGLVDSHPDTEQVEVEVEVEKSRPVMHEVEEVVTNAAGVESVVMKSVPMLDEDGKEMTETYTETETRTETRKTGTETLGVKHSILLMKAAVALQEAMARIESLEARLDALEN